MKLLKYLLSTPSPRPLLTYVVHLARDLTSVLTASKADGTQQKIHSKSLSFPSRKSLLRRLQAAQQLAAWPQLTMRSDAHPAQAGCGLQVCNSKASHKVSAVKPIEKAGTDLGYKTTPACGEGASSE